ncbi:alpha-1,2-fucosyltransferase [Haloferula sp.]|uniref:alpha-1,2-fucosyltransferase n=1 Tax=Haloferula sp. TaxID=2497595 RepID=UPI00329AD7E5
MIRVVLLGRTANNMFQYALGRVLAAKHGVPLVLDGSWFNAEGWEQVSHFLRLPLQAKVVRPFSLGSRVLRKLSGKHHWEFRGVSVLRETPDDQSFDPKFLNAPADCMLFGYFQSPKYFMGLADELREELNGLLSDAVDSSEEVYRKLASGDSVAVHVRRQDYLSLPAFQVCDLGYFKSSMDSMRERLSNPRFHVFSDDPEWCRETFNEGDVEVVDSGSDGLNPLYDLRIMSLARHHVIANSSYSWWAAWLADSPEQQVIMPDRWFARDIKAPMADKQWKS